MNSTVSRLYRARTAVHSTFPGDYGTHVHSALDGREKLKQVTHGVLNEVSGALLRAAAVRYVLQG